MVLYHLFNAFKIKNVFRCTVVRFHIKSIMIKSEELSENVVLNELEPQPDFIYKRIKLWEKFKDRYIKEIQSKISSVIKVSAKDKDGKERLIEASSWHSTPFEISKNLGPKSWSESLVISKVNGQLWDLDRPLEDNCSLEFLKFDDHDGQQVFWHSSAHVLGEALERLYGCHLCYGPPIESGFYYDCFMDHLKDKGDDPITVSGGHMPSIENLMKNICNEKQIFERLELTKDELLEMFDYNEFKVRILKEKVKEDRTTIYRCGTLIDLCKGPHVRHTGYIKAFKVTKACASLWEGKVDAERLQRIYGISFPEIKHLKEWIRFQEEAAKRDHRKIGKDQGLFFFHELSPGSAFITPRGAHIYNTLCNFLRQEYRKRGFKEVISPNIYNSKLWKTSGHWDHYSENMFIIDLDKEKFALKPMNCPGHCIMFDSETRSWRDLPLRFADFGVLHRNEIHGALSGLTRVRRFQQDDAHIFCTHNQIEEEILNALQFLKDVYTVFGFTFELYLSTRPESFIGEIKLWNSAEDALKRALDKLGYKWVLNPGDGAFYGPKIDVSVRDALKRSHQCATIQLDFQLPLRFELTYAAEDGSKKTPVIIHRAIFGSIERFIAILAENCAGKWPFWLSPRQAIVLPIADSYAEYAKHVQSQIYNAGFNVDTELDPSLTINRKVRNAQLAQYNFILVVGEKEKENGTVNVRTRDNKVHGEVKVPDLIKKFKVFQESRDLKAEEAF